jgi:uncharacterized protein (DUF2235 family)
MFKTIVLFSDGTGNSSASPFKTNVFRLYDALDMSPEAGQIAYYDDGVGSSQHRWLAAIAGAFGFGLKRNVLDLYKFLTRHYADAIRDPRTGEIVAKAEVEPPRIACFGFSRGAFTIRVLIGLVQSQGLPVKALSEAELDRFANSAYLAMRAEHFHTVLGLERLWRISRDRLVIPLLDRVLGRKSYDRGKNYDVKGIDFLGLWDTVGAYGMPVEELRIVIDRFVFPLTFTEYDLLDIVKISRHALSIDDERDAFTPIPFDDRDACRKDAEARAAGARRLVAAGVAPAAAERQAENELCDRSRQIWFAGVHANVGGGYPDDSQAFLPLRWIMLEAMKHGVAFRPAFVAEVCAKATAFGQLYDSRSGLNALYRYKPRDISFLLDDARRRTLRKRGEAESSFEPARPLVHESVIHRMAAHFQGYAPIALPAALTVVDDEGRPRYEIDFGSGKSGFAKRAGNDDHAPALDEAVARLSAPDPNGLRLVRNAVFWRRVGYHFTLWSLILLLLTPLLDRDNSPATNILATAFQWIVGFLRVYLPGFLSPWLDAFAQYPMICGTLLAIFAISYVCGAALKRTIEDRSRAAWGMAPEIEPGPLSRPGDRLADVLLNSRPLTATWRFVSNRALPWGLLGATFLAALFTLDRLYFHYLAYRGEICRGSGAAAPLEAPTAFDFDTRAPCAASGVLLQKGRSYAVSFEIESGWRDGRDPSLAANLGGLKRNEISWPQKFGFFFAGLAVRRVIGEPWFEPILQIGPNGLWIVPAEPAAPFPPGSEKEKMRLRFKAPADGELFLYVNDAYSGFVPTGALLGQSGWNADGSPFHTYGNNSGSAKIVVAPLPEEFGD